MINLGTIRKKENPILKTQTNPIAWKDKLEEIKDGVKGPPAPSWKLYPKSRFQTEDLIHHQGSESEPRGAGDKIPELGAPIPEDQRDKTKDSNEDWWHEEDQTGASEKSKNSVKETSSVDEGEEVNPGESGKNAAY